MKIEICESLFYSWLRHIKGCQIVQTNWKPSPAWDFKNIDAAERLMNVVDTYFREEYEYDIFKKNTVSQLIQQAESDLVGLSFNQGKSVIYAVESAFHEDGLNYGGKDETIARIIKKFVRAGLCIYAYFGAAAGELIFCSPKINNAVMNDLSKCTEELNVIFKENGFEFNANIVSNDMFYRDVLVPVFEISKTVSDTSELFMRSIQLEHMFDGQQYKTAGSCEKAESMPYAAEEGTYGNMKIGGIAKYVLKPMLESGAADEEEIEKMQTLDYSKKTFGLNTYPLLVRRNTKYDANRYYSSPLYINGIAYAMSSQWFEKSRPQLLLWIEIHKAKHNEDESNA